MGSPVLAWRRDLPTTALIAFVVASALLFVALTAQFLHGEEGLARALLLGLPAPFDAAPPTGPRWLADMARDISALGSAEVVAALTAAVLGYMIIAGRIGPALFIMLSVGAGTLGGYALKLFFERVRPHHVVDAEGIILNTSFPSGHAMLAALFYLTLGVILARGEPRRWLRLYVLAVAAVITTLVGVSRVYLGVHRPTDVAAGWAVGAGWVAFCCLGLRVVHRHRYECSGRSRCNKKAASLPLDRAARGAP